MNTNALIDIVHKVQSEIWVDKINETHRAGHLCEWVSTFHPEKLPCKLEGTFYRGAFNVGLKMVFNDGITWMVRFPRVGMVCDDYKDEKVAMEVTALDVVRKKTTIPVPRVWAWGSGSSNPLGLGPFIIMDFINGTSLSDLLRDPEAECLTRVIREDISDEDIEFIYRQLANFLLQLFKLDFDRIGSLPLPQADAAAQDSTRSRPLTCKVHSILQNGGVNTLGDRAQGFTTTTQYFQYLAEQEWEQLLYQQNSVSGTPDAKYKYHAFKVLKTFIPDLINAKYDRGKFKLICDDLGLANLIVREDFTIVGVVDLEWSYTGPAQLFGSAPWWLLQDRPVNIEWGYHGAPRKIVSRYCRYLDIFIRVLEEEEAKLPGHEDRELSSLVKWSIETGAMWLHMLLSSGFNDHTSFPFSKLRLQLGTEWAKRAKKLDDEEERTVFALQKIAELDKYDEALAKLEENKVLMDDGKITKEEFVARSLVGDENSSSPKDS